MAVSKAGSFSVECTASWDADNKQENKPMAKRSPWGEVLPRVGNGAGERKHVGASCLWVVGEGGFSKGRHLRGERRR